MDKLIKFVFQLGMLAILLSIFGRVISSMFFGLFGGLLWGLTPLLVIAFFIVAIVKMVGGIGNKDAKQGNRKSSSQRQSFKLSRFLNDVEMKEMDVSLRDFFRSGDRLIIKDDLYLAPRDGMYKSIESLELWFNGEAIATVGTLAESHPSKCAEITDFLTGKNRTERQSFGADNKKNAETLSRAQEYIRNIDSINKGISDELITANLHTTTALLRTIHKMELDNPSSEKLRKLYDQYLPILMSTLTKFMRLSEAAPLSRDYIVTKSKLAETVELINEAMTNISKDYYGGEMTEINVETKTLQSILRKDGVVGGDFVFPERLDEIVEEDNQLEVLEK
ncbi:MAG: hypothetical protein Q4A41_03820 [Bacillota bacterium]|nr:hypothetical protein [Bacillota bacterium]